MPAGWALLMTFVGLLSAPVVVLTLKAETLLEALLDTKRNLPVECMAAATGELPVDTLAGLKLLSAPVVWLMRNAEIVLAPLFTTYRKLLVGSTTRASGSRSTLTGEPTGFSFAFKRSSCEVQVPPLTAVHTWKTSRLKVVTFVT